MSDTAINSQARGSIEHPSLAGVNPGRLFLGSCLALIATAVSFAVLAAIMGALKSHFLLTNKDVGWIVGAGTWGFTVSIFVLGPLCDALGMRRLVYFAFLCHIAGPIIMIMAPGFWSLFWGALIISMGNGTVEAVCNPLVASVFPERKTEKLNHFHMWFPGGIVIGGLLCFFLNDVIHVTAWQVKLILIVIPAIVYGIIFFGQKIPATERVQSGLSFQDMVTATLTRPLFLVLLACMMITASLELGPQRWIPSILEAGGLHGILVLVWITGLMAVLRGFAGPVVHRLSPTGLLLTSAILAGIGLLLLSYAESVWAAMAAATVFAMGVCYFWPTMLGVVAERVPRGGSLALALMGGIGMLAVGVVTTPLMGDIADRYLNEKLSTEQTQTVLQQINTAFPQHAASANPKQAADIKAVADQANKAFLQNQAQGKLVQPDTAAALRMAKDSGVEDPTVKQAADLINPADNYGGRMSFRWVAPLALLLIGVFGTLYARDKAAGGYRVEHINKRA